MVPSSVTNRKLRKRPPLSRYSRTLLTLIVADVLLLLFLTYGYAFPSHMALPDPQRRLPEAYYDYSAKTSPFVVSAKPAKVRFQAPRS